LTCPPSTLNINPVMSNIQQIYKTLYDANWSHARICGHLQGILEAIEKYPEQAETIIKQSVGTTKEFVNKL
jgi:hypothetical protein